MLIVLGQCHNVSLGCYLQAATAAHLHIWTLKFANKLCVTLEHSDVKSVTVAVAHQDVTSITNVNSIRVVGEVLTTDTAQKLSFFTEYDDTVTLHNHENNEPMVHYTSYSRLLKADTLC